jgi:hypothetical protein
VSTGIDFRVLQEEDLVAAPKVLGIAVVSVAVGLLAVFFEGTLLERNAGRIWRSPIHDETPRAGREISNIEQTPILEARDGLDLRDKQREELTHYAWVNRDAGIAAIPIERAIDLVVEEQR